jgi:hypothetical protein
VHVNLHGPRVYWHVSCTPKDLRRGGTRNKKARISVLTAADESRVVRTNGASVTTGARRSLVAQSSVRLDAYLDQPRAFDGEGLTYAKEVLNWGSSLVRRGASCHANSLRVDGEAAARAAQWRFGQGGFFDPYEMGLRDRGRRSEE